MRSSGRRVGLGFLVATVVMGLQHDVQGAQLVIGQATRDPVREGRKRHLLIGHGQDRGTVRTGARSPVTVPVRHVLSHFAPCAATDGS
jgi:hypothetical protein